MKSSNILIIGAGVTGLSAAYHLVLARHGRIMVLDKGGVGGGSSSRAAAIITGHLWSETGVRVRKLALRRYRELSEELEGYRFNSVGCLNLFDAHSWTEREPLLGLYRRLGVPFDVIDAQEVRRRWPQLMLPADIVGLHDPLGGYSEPDDYLAALSRRCINLGVEIRIGQAVTGLLRRSGKACGVRTAEGEIDADLVVCCSFAWTNAWLADAGVRLPIKSFVHQRYTTVPAAAAVELPAVNASFLGGYVRPAKGNRLLLGIETPHREEWRVGSLDFQMSSLTTTDELPAQQLRERFTGIVPILGTLPFEQQHIGLITFSMDYEPVIGAVGAVPGLYVAAGFHSGGFAYNPATGVLLSELITRGKTSIDIRAYAPDRFDPAHVDAYLATTIRQEDTAKRRH